MQVERNELSGFTVAALENNHEQQQPRTTVTVQRGESTKEHCVRARAGL